MVGILNKIVEARRIRLEAEMKLFPLDALKKRVMAGGFHKPADFAGALRRGREEYGISIIGEVKKASPSKGTISEDFDPVRIATQYYENHLQAVSVLTEKDNFMGDDQYLAAVRRSIPIPILRKDFIIDIWQVYQSLYLGADAVLLIAALLAKEELKKFIIVSHILGLQCLVEVHDECELEAAIICGAKIIGINNRDLKTFETDTGTTSRLIRHIPGDRVIVSESGISSAADMDYLKQCGVDAVLIGEAFMTAPSITGKVLELRGNY